MLGRADAHIKAAVHTLDDGESSSVTVRSSIETLQTQLKSDASVLLPSHASLLAAICKRLDLSLGSGDISLTKRCISVAMDCLACETLMAAVTELEAKVRPPPF